MPVKNSSKVLFFGTLGVFSHTVLINLLSRNINVSGIVIPGTELAQSLTEKYIHIPVLQEPQHDTIELLAIQHDIPIHYLHDVNSDQSFKQLSALTYDFIFIACFPQILSQRLINLPSTAALNLHPSLLPEYRGSAPLFWQLKDVATRFGVTIHLLSQTIDSGNIILQKEYTLADGMRGRAIDASLGKLGGLLFIKAVELYSRNRVVPKIQDQSSASYQPSPKPADFELSTDWTARHAFNFMRGTSEWKQPFRVTIAEHHFLIENAIAWSPAASIGETFQIDGDIITIKFAQGLLKAGLKEAREI